MSGDDFPRVRNPLDGVVITKPQACEPGIRGAGNPADEEAARKIVTFEEMLASRHETAPVTASRVTSREPVTSRHASREEAITASRPKTPAERAAAYRARKRSAE